MPKLKARVAQVGSMFRILWGTCIAAAIAGSFLPLTTYLANPNPPYRIPYKALTPLNHENNIVGFLVVSVYESLNGFLFCQVVAAIDILPVFFFNITAGLLEEFSDRMSEFRGSAERESGIDENLKIIEEYIEVHLEIKAILEKAQTIFSPMIFTQASVSLVILCTTSFNLSKVSLRFKVKEKLNNDFHRYLPSTMWLASSSCSFTFVRWSSKYFCLATLAMKSPKHRSISQRVCSMPIGRTKARTSKQQWKCLWKTPKIG